MASVDGGHVSLYFAGMSRLPFLISGLLDWVGAPLVALKGNPKPCCGPTGSFEPAGRAGQVRPGAEPPDP